MRLPILALAFAAVVIASPAAAHEAGPYVGVEGGILFPRTTHYSVNSVRVQSVPTGGGLLGQTVTTTNNVYGSGFVSDYKRGVDLDAIAGYGFGIVRLEAELGYKRTRQKRLTASNSLLAAINTAPISGVNSTSFNFADRTRIVSAMANALLNYDLMPGIRVYGGGGAGRARVAMFGARETVWAYQLIGGVSTAISPNVDLGLKYRYFQTARLHFNNSALFTDPATGATSSSSFTEVGKFRSHSLLASLIFNFGRAMSAPMVETPAPPPPPPPPPATQTCADGSVVDAAAACPISPPPPPPPPPPPSKGERG